jgi:NAD(P)H-hydrate repair Nnr-like enzyme with NAD(P)H-hydrate dehydratase domain
MMINEQLLRNWPLPPLTGNGKKSRGDVWVVGGARGTPGAAMLAGVAALRVGAGRLTLSVAESVATAVAVAVPESGVAPLPEPRAGPFGARSPTSWRRGLRDAMPCWWAQVWTTHAILLR